MNEDEDYQGDELVGGGIQDNEQLSQEKLVGSIVQPFVGMLFETLEEARQYYVEYVEAAIKSVMSKREGPISVIRRMMTSMTWTKMMTVVMIRWMWKGRSTVTVNHKHHWLVEQKLLHYVLVENSSGAMNGMENTMMQKFWDSALALEPPDESDTHSEMLALMESEATDLEANYDVEAMRIKLDPSLQNEDFNNGLVQALHDAAQVFELSIKEQRSMT
ncbi:hypothetical protein Dimus_003478 [Dionaea muscipula]